MSIIFNNIDNMSFSDINDESEFIPLMTSEDVEALEKESLPEVLPILPLTNTVLFPGVVIPINAGRDMSIKLIKDANKLLVENPIDAFKEARKQDAFIFWNHPYWISQSPDAGVPVSEFHYALIEDGLIEGIEVVNDTTFSNEAMQLALVK